MNTFPLQLFIFIYQTKESITVDRQNKVVLSFFQKVLKDFLFVCVHAHRRPAMIGGILSQQISVPVFCPQPKKQRAKKRKKKKECRRIKKQCRLTKLP
jgi:hypothetical protein